MNKAIKILIASLILTGCDETKDLQPDQYMQFVENRENGILQIVTAGTTEYTIQLATPSYMVCREFSDQLNEVESRLVNERLKELNGYMFFLVNIRPLKKGESVVGDLRQKSMAENMTMYYQSMAADDITLVTDSLVQSPVVYHFEDNYGLTPYNTIVAGFKVPDTWTFLKLVFNDRYNDNPLIQTKYSKEKIANLPGLALK